MKNAVSKTMVIFLCISLVLLLGLGYQCFSLYREKRVLEEKTQGLQGKVALLEKKYDEKKALETQLTRAKAALEGQQRSVRSDLEKVEKEKEALSEQNKALSGEIKQLQPKLVSAESKSAELLDQLTKVKAERADWEGKFDKAVKDYEKQVAQLTAEKKKAENELQSSLRSVEQKLGRCETNNARLCVIAQELIEKFKNKGVSTSILQIEPFTQIQKVEMENLLEEYMERIEREEMKKAVSKKP